MTPTSTTKRPLALTVLCLYLSVSCLWAVAIGWSRLRHPEVPSFISSGLSPRFTTAAGLLLNVLYLATAGGMLLGRRSARTAFVALLVVNLAWALILSAGQPLILFAIRFGGVAIVAGWAAWVLSLPAVNVWFGLPQTAPKATTD
ncbi:hypothetical protein [Dyella sp.]|jgi:hypothetical protein|uniref:hypothetical protein n=1 Tax=Dyella sp. TaxID=1869338 RepID=UPI002D78D459|nr:hypothetical protein [Dyella sp.]HET6431447.1 hypothetical protein [Dyella sp.]